MAYTTIDNPELYFQTKLYVQNASTNAITLDGSENMQPDWVWIKNRDSSNRDHRIFDSVRGANKPLKVNGNTAEATATDTLNSFDSDGFTLGADSEGYGVNDLNTNNTVAWNWKAGGSASSNSNGSTTSSVSAGSTQGFSISTFTSPGSGTFTFGHGLSSAPKVVILKRRDGSQNWIFGHDSAGWGYWSKLNDTDAKLSNTSMWQNTAPSSSIVSLDTSQIGASNTFVAYCLSEVKGYSKFTSFTGNGSTDGPFVYLGFRASFVIIKRTDSSANWQMYDNKRDGFNGAGYPAKGNESLRPNTSEAESSATGYDIDICANGIKLRNSSSTMNSSGATHIVMAFAESPLVNSNGIPNNAR